MIYEKLSPVKRALFEKWLQGQSSANGLQSVPQRPQNSLVKLSSPQQRHLFLELLDRGTAVNNISIFLQLRGKLDSTALEKSANQILARHEVLRTRFSVNMGIPTPQILNDLRLTIPVLDLQEIKEEEKAAAARQLAEKEVLQPFDLSQAPLLRLRLYQFDSEHFRLLLVIHHTIADGWSLGVFLNELMQFYQANTTGSAVQVPDLPVQYYDYAHWQTDEMRNEAFQPLRAYWKKQLGGELPLLELPVDRARGTRQTFSGGTHRFLIPKDKTKALEELSQSEDGTLFMTLLAAFYLLLHRYSGQDDLLVGTPIANRTSPELEHLIGIFINTLVLRINLAGNPSFRELLRQVRKISLEAYAHQNFPYEHLMEELKPRRDLNRPPLFQVVFNLQNSPLPRVEIAGLETAFLEIDRGVSQFDLTLIISKVDGQCEALVEYNADLFERPTIIRMFQSYVVLLENALTQPDSPISKFQMLTREESDHVLFGLNQTEFDFPREKCIHQLIEEQVEKTPDAVAIVYENIKLTYDELNQRANVLARKLQKLGVAPEIRVGILMKKSLETAIALLAVLKAGGAYVPIHIASPQDRVQLILKDADALVLLTNIESVQLNEFKKHVINVNDEILSSEINSLHPQSPVNSTNLAYILYTSGSTGQPKGVMVNHSSLVNFLWSMRHNPGMNKDAVVLALASISFDISTLELLLPLMTGAKVVIGSEEMTTNPSLIGEAINNHQVNFLQATPATWQLLIDSGWKGKPDLKALCGGDVLTRKMADQLLERVGSLWNMYGPTETTVWCMYSKIEKGDTPIFIGQPIGNMQVYILDRYLQPVPTGVIGELHISGAGLARAYLNSHLLTQEKFIPCSFPSQAGKRLYKSGDLARYLPDYSIEILGRLDDQVKVQGHRIELGEITAILLQHPAVKDGIVITRNEKAGDKRLVAYFVPTDNPVPAANQLREFLGKKLPAYMIPGFFICMDVLPLSPNGKINRKALPTPEVAYELQGYVAPRNEEEQIMATIWQNVLDVERVGIHDNFFELGGASIQSIQVVAQANMYGYPINAMSIFQYQTVAELVANIKGELQ